MTTEHNVRSEFLGVYDRCADDIFATCYEQVAHRDIAKYLTRNIFMRTWEIVSAAGSHVKDIERTLYRTTKDHIKGFLQSKRNYMNYSENLWTLTLSQ